MIDELLERLEAEMWSKEDIFAIHMAAEEALTNAIRHGNANDPSKMIRITFQVAKQSVRMIFVDEGVGFNPAKVPDPTAPENLDRESGRGVRLIQDFMTHVEYNEQGNQLTMEKQRSCDI